MGDAEKLASIAERDPDTLKSDAVMMGAVDFRHHALVEWLLARGGNVNARARATSRHTALHSAAWNGDLEMATLLVAAGADLVARDEEHHGTPLGWAEASLDITSNPRCKDVAAYLEKLSPVR
jgi:ankyrin repeat protein